MSRIDDKVTHPSFQKMATSSFGVILKSSNNWRWKYGISEMYPWFSHGFFFSMFLRAKFPCMDRFLLVSSPIEGRKPPSSQHSWCWFVSCVHAFRETISHSVGGWTFYSSGGQTLRMSTSSGRQSPWMHMMHFFSYWNWMLPDWHFFFPKIRQLQWLELTLKNHLSWFSLSFII